MNPYLILGLILAYFGFLILISFFTKGKYGNSSFFNADKNSSWFLVAFGMIGTTLSGVTFISVPGWVEASQFSYMQMVLGYIIGYFIIATVLMPLYYKLNLISIYSYLGKRFGPKSYLSGALFFLISRVVGASFRLYLVASVMQYLIFDSLGIPFWATVSLTILLIWVYTFRSGIKTIIWTDTLQTFFMLAAVVISLIYVSSALDLNLSSIYELIKEQKGAQIFFFDNFKSGQFFWKQFFAGAFIAIVMTGLDQDMMQKNLTCKSLGEAQKNMFWFTTVLVIIKFVFLVLGLLLTLYATTYNIDAHGDNLYPAIVSLPEMNIILLVFFILGLIAAAYSSADSALTALTTSFCIDILKIDKKYEVAKQILIRKRVHIYISFLLILVILFFKYIINNQSVISKLFTFAGYTYGPLLGLYFVGLFSKWKIKDKWSLVVCFISPVIGFLINLLAEQWMDFSFGFFILILNGFVTVLGLYSIRERIIEVKNTVSVN